LQEVAEQIAAKGGKAEVIPCHMGDLTQVADLLRQIGARHGRLDILVNNAATNPHVGDMLSATEAVWDKTFEVNLKGPFFLTQGAARLMAGSAGGSIINTASIDGIKSGDLRGIYSITKAAVIAMTRAYAKELAAHRIRVNAILPGLVDTYMSRILLDDDVAYQDVMRTVPMGRHAEPHELAGAALYLASDASSYTTGAILTVDGGALA
jgi:NAD(P)-dependent dehydrogenase (short-subunit alcohol dehydrogenase family)